MMQLRGFRRGRPAPAKETTSNRLAILVFESGFLSKLRENHPFRVPTVGKCPEIEGVQVRKSNYFNGFPRFTPIGPVYSSINAANRVPDRSPANSWRNPCM
jgi:hypothetical protein